MSDKYQNYPSKNFDVATLAPLVTNVRLMPDEKADGELLASIKKDGILQDPVVGELTDGTIGLIAGFRRVAAAVKLELGKISCKVVPVKSKAECVFLNLVENLQRKDPHYVEFAKAIGVLLKDGQKPKAIAARLGKHESVVYNFARLAESPALDFLEAEYLKGNPDLPSMYEITQLLGKKEDAANAKGRIEAFMSAKKERETRDFGSSAADTAEGSGTSNSGSEEGKPEAKKLPVLPKNEIHEERRKVRKIEKFLESLTGDAAKENAEHAARVQGWRECLEWITKNPKFPRPESDYWTIMGHGTFEFDEDPDATERARKEEAEASDE